MDNTTAYIVAGAFILLIAFCAVLLIKNENTLRQHLLISRAIYEHNIDKIDNYKFDEQISFNCMRSYEGSLFRLWDWGYKNIVPPEIFERIKPYINE